MDAYMPSTTLFVLLLPFIAAIFAPALTRLFKHNAAWLLAIVPVAIFWHFSSFLPDVSRGEVVTGGYQWIPAFRVNFSWLIDGLSLTFALLISGIGALIVLYSGGYLKNHPHLGRFFSFILMFMGSMLGLVTSDNFLMFFVFWELTSITSFLLIGFDHKREASRRAALQALVVTGGGGLFLLAGLLLIWNVTGISEMSLLLLSHGALADSPFYIAIFVLVLGGAFTKSAQFPLHFWLPNAMEAPTPVSAYLHSATMVKAGVYLLMRLNPVLGDTVAWETVLPIFGGTTLIIGTLLAIRQTDMKLMLAYTTVSSLGLLVMLTGFGNEKAVEAAVLYLVAHSMFKGALFMVAGAIDHEAGSRDVTKVGGLMSSMPIIFAAAFASAFSMAGLPPFFGFLAKEEIYAGLWHVEAWPLLLTLVAIVGNGLMFVIGFAVALKPFLGERKAPNGHVHDGPILLWLGPAILAICSLVTALFSSVTHAFISSPMSTAVEGEPVSVHISIIPHIGMPLLLSLVTIAFGIVAYRNLARMREAMARLLAAIGWGPDKGFDQFIRGTVRISFHVTQIVQPGRLEFYMKTTFIVLAIAVLVPMFMFDELPGLPTMPESLSFYETAIMAIAAAGLLSVLYAKDRLTAIVSLGIQGFAVALLFMLFGAPDLSFTQFMVETLSVVILALAMTRLRLTPADHRPAGKKVVDMIISVIGATAFVMLLLKVTQLPFDATLSEFFTRYSLSIAHGANIVNVILVDFRGTDTWGEIAVVMVAGLAILSLIRIQLRPAVPIATNDPSEEERR
ncbi:putative monovalent cation/H+ antiporter subunit A [Hoeflea sp. TYP-13]|uniref:putative monovalent cation/H+ antiporter subunit A n=1 Tax=Hoeflea sp. TYP-13 TaxID=3230023 RepID=UPI0034C62234